MGLSIDCLDKDLLVLVLQWVQQLTREVDANEVDAHVLCFRAVSKLWRSTVAEPNALLNTFSQKERAKRIFLRDDPLHALMWARVLGHGCTDLSVYCSKNAALIPARTQTRAIRLDDSLARACLVRCVNLKSLTITSNLQLSPARMLNLLNGAVPQLTSLKITPYSDTVSSDTVSVDKSFCLQLATIFPRLECFQCTVRAPNQEYEYEFEHLPISWYEAFPNLTHIRDVGLTAIQDILTTLTQCPRLRHLDNLALKDESFQFEDHNCSVLGQIQKVGMDDTSSPMNIASTFLQRCHNLTDLSLWNMVPEGGSIGQLIRTLASTSKLTSLDLGGYDNESFGDMDIILICEAQPSLTSLDVNGSDNITDAALTAMHKLHHLETLKLCYCVNNLSALALGALVRENLRLRNISITRGAEWEDQPDVFDRDIQPGSDALRAIDELLHERGGKLDDGESRYSGCGTM